MDWLNKAKSSATPATSNAVNDLTGAAIEKSNELIGPQATSKPKDAAKQFVTNRSPVVEREYDPASGFNVKNLVGSLSNSGVAKTSDFQVLISPPPGLNQSYPRELMYRAETVELPGRTIATIEHRFTNYGPLNKVAYGAMYQDVSISFILSEDMREKVYFEQWQQLMADTAPTALGNFNAKYFNDYVGTIEIQQFSRTGDLKTTHVLNQAYPIVINAVSMGWAEDQIARMTVQMAMRYYEVKRS